jgi:hypothetical protein
VKEKRRGIWSADVTSPQNPPAAKNRPTLGGERTAQDCDIAFASLQRDKTFGLRCGLNRDRLKMDCGVEPWSRCGERFIMALLTSPRTVILQRNYAL